LADRMAQGLRRQGIFAWFAAALRGKDGRK
jgi:hypothetical protein